MIDRARIAVAERKRRAREHRAILTFCAQIILGWVLIVGVLKGLEWAL